MAESIAALTAVAVVSFVASNAVLAGPDDPEAWVAFVPGLVFYASLWLIFSLALAFSVIEVVINPIARWQAGRSSP